MLTFVWSHAVSVGIHGVTACRGAKIKIFGRILWPIIVQFRCPHSGSTFSLHESIDFDTLSTNSLVVTRTDPQFFCILRSNINIFY